jgi:DNA helicase II / ATP-dependent DNA helicase PcrA
MIYSVKCVKLVHIIFPLSLNDDRILFKFGNNVISTIVRFIADLHIHSHYSLATSKELSPEFLDYWARIKGIRLVATGDFTHPKWIAELKEKLIPAEEGLFQLKPELRMKLPYQNPESENEEVRFVLSSEISSIYKKNGKVRKVHNLLYAPDFETVEKMQYELSRIGNIKSDGRPILGLDSQNLLDLALNINPEIFFVPAHIWTPWFSVLGEKGGFDSIEECFGDLSPYIHAVETGLSTNPALNWMCSFLDRFTLLSNSDAHSPDRLGRNANVLNCELSYQSVFGAI